ncbi:MAG: helix-turn-helix transcriptional regulator [Pirellulaceae bacterium]
MRYSFRLAELLGHAPDPRKRPGTIKSIVEYTGLDRHQVAALLKNDFKYVPLKALSRLCDYLVEHGYASADELPGALFAVAPENFWDLLARRRRLELCLGVRRTDTLDPEGALVVANDSLLLGELLNGVSTLGGTAKQQRRASSEHEPKPHPEYLRQSLVWSPGQGSEEEVAGRAREVYDDFAEWGGDKALVCLGSAKSNPVVELMLAGSFGCEPHVSEDDVGSPKKRSCPFYLAYRENDPKHSSCAGGRRLAKGKPAAEPGIYYEEPGGNWASCPWNGRTSDAALVFYIHRESQGRLEMMLGGFSGRATRLLARTLATRAEDFWPPTYDAQGIQVGIFVVHYTYSAPDETHRDILRDDVSASAKIIPLSGKVIERRLAPPA